jgi:hypothetical protein
MSASTETSLRSVNFEGKVKDYGVAYDATKSQQQTAYFRKNDVYYDTPAEFAALLPSCPEKGENLSS